MALYEPEFEKRLTDRDLVHSRNSAHLCANFIRNNFRGLSEADFVALAKKLDAAGFGRGAANAAHIAVIAAEWLGSPAIAEKAAQALAAAAPAPGRDIRLSRAEELLGIARDMKRVLEG